LRSAHAETLATFRAGSEARIADLEGQNQRETARAVAAEAEAARFKSDLAASGKLLEEETQRASELQRTLEAALSAERKGRADDVAERDARIVDLETQLVEVRRRSAEQDQSIESLSDEVAERENEVAARQRDIVVLQGAKASAEAKGVALEAELSAARAAVDKARTALGVAQAFLERAEVGTDDANGA
jgi:chromosome segregation ATPase